MRVLHVTTISTINSLIIRSSVNYKSAESWPRILEKESGMTRLHHNSILHHNDSITSKNSVNSVGNGHHSPVSQALLDNILQQLIIN